ncbi:MAG: pyridoxal-phosphate dependent enzyme [Acetobacteraceae bacterium]
MSIAYLDPETGETWPLEPPRWSGPPSPSRRARPLMLTAMPGIGRAEIEVATPGLWRYRAALPLPWARPISMSEGMTPLIERPLYGAPALLKCEWVMPTGSFKDRGASVMLSLLRAQGIDAVLEDSSGNGGAAIAAYAAAGGIKAVILAPEATSPAKLVAMRAAGAEVELISGDRQATAEAALERAKRVFYASHNWHPFFLEGTKTLAYELWEQLGFRAPDNVIVPCGAGSNVLGLAIGFGELVRAGEIALPPRIFAAQPENCAPIAAAFLAGAEGPVPTPIRPTIAEGTAIAAPIRLRAVLEALRASRGGVARLTETEIAAATLDLARMGLYVEPTAAQAAAAFRHLVARGAIAPDALSIVVLTGSGLKAGGRIAELLEGAA